MKICVAGQGAFGQKHLDALKRIPEVEVTSLVGGNQDSTAAVASWLPPTSEVTWTSGIRFSASRCF